MPRPKRPPPGFPKEPRHPRRRTAAAAAPAPAPAPGGGNLLRALGRCRALLDELLRHEDGWVFAAPVDARALGLRDYYTVVSDPMDLGTVLRRLERRRYADPLAFAADVRLTFRNAMSYNNRGDPVYESAADLSGIFEAGWASILAALPPPPSPADTERKLRFTDELTRLPVGVQRTVAGILKERGECLREENGKVEVDLGKADAPTLDEIDSLLSEHRAALAADVEALMQEP
ncbi:transcription factor GTE3, chloroplastic-like [Phragmites australis]|uniref:transcription factor GTE3, chloroplastic-like n=1 Tax=Phragmites australis TaxID=29695 RepID=UPI002D7800DB|nr:transcription factor GTE3, chloroplastic-like [Phragmites australis]